MFYHHSSKRLEARIHEEDRQRPFYFMKKMYRILGRRETEEKAVEVNEEKDEECYTIIRRFYWTKLVVEQRRFLWLLTRSCYLVRTRWRVARVLFCYVKISLLLAITSNYGGGGIRVSDAGANCYVLRIDH